MAEIDLSLNMINESVLISLKNNLLTWEECKEICINQIVEMKTEFVWLFVIGFFFSETSRIIYQIPSKHIDSDKKLSLSRGFRVSGYLLQLVGILYYLFFVI